MNYKEVIPLEKGPKRFFCVIQDKIEGPFDLIEMAAHIKYGNIGGETLVCREGEGDTHSFRAMPEFVMAQGISIEEIALHLQEKERSVAASGSPKKSVFPWRLYALIATFLLLIATLTFAFYYVQRSNRGPDYAPVDDKDPHFVFPNHYQASMDITVKNSTYTSTVYVDNGKVRMENQLTKTSNIVIIRRDQHQIYVIIPALRVVIPRPYYARERVLGEMGPETKYKYIGTDVIDGVPNAKYQVSVAKDTWFLTVDTAKMVPLDMESMKTGSGIHFESYQAGPQDPALFEAPGDYKWMN